MFFAPSACLPLIICTLHYCSIKTVNPTVYEAWLPVFKVLKWMSVHEVVLEISNKCHTEMIKVLSIFFKNTAKHWCSPKTVYDNARVDFSFYGDSWGLCSFTECRHWVCGYPGQLGWGGAGVMSYLSYCCVSSPPLHRRNLLRRALALMHLRPL